MNKIDRFKILIRYAKSLGIASSQEEFGKLMGYTNPSAFSQVINGKSKEPKEFSKKMCSLVPESNFNWLEYGEGDMLGNNTPTITQTNVNGNNNYVGGNSINMNARAHANDEDDIPYAEQVPVVPPTVVRQAGVDILEYVRDNFGVVEKSSVVVNDMQLTAWIPMPDDCMAPEIQKGDRLGLCAYKKGEENPIPGKIYAIDTMSNGTIVRYLYITAEGDFLMRSQNPTIYPDFVVKKSDVIAVYKKLIMVRI
jgi:phage repressor protein C with HTH and peptisase S24 domain